MRSPHRAQGSNAIAFTEPVDAIELRRRTSMRAARLVATVHHLEQRGELRRVVNHAGALPLYRPAHAQPSGPSLRWSVQPGLPTARLRQHDRRRPVSIAGRLRTGVASRPMTTGVVLVLLAATVSMALSGWGLPLDLEVYRRGGQSVLDGAALYEQPYGMLPFTYPPLAAIAFTVLAWLPALVATTVMTVGSYAALFLLVLLTVSYLKAPPWWVPVGFLAAALAEPVTATVSLGQINLILALLVLLDLLQPTRRWSGVLLGIAICIKLTPAIFVFAVLAQRDLRMLRRTVATVALGSLLPALLVPGAWAQFWFHALWDPQRVGGLAYTGNQSLTGALWRAVGPGGSPSLTRLLTVAVLGLLAIALVRKGRPGRLTGILACAFAGLLISPVSWSHHWVWVVPFILWAAHRAGTLSALTPVQARHVPATQRTQARASTTAWMTTTIALAWVVVTAGRFIWATPSGDGSEFLAPPAVKLLADGYTLLGVATLILLVAVVHQRPQPSAFEPASPPAPRP